MVTFYYSTGGDATWTLQHNFLTDRPTCDWNNGLSGISNQGVICSDTTGDFRGIQMGMYVYGHYFFFLSQNMITRKRKEKEKKRFCFCLQIFYGVLNFVPVVAIVVFVIVLSSLSSFFPSSAYNCHNK